MSGHREVKIVFDYINLHAMFGGCFIITDILNCSIATHNAAKYCLKNITQDNLRSDLNTFYTLKFKCGENPS